MKMRPFQLLLLVMSTALPAWSGANVTDPATAPATDPATAQMSLLNRERIIQVGDRLVFQVIEEREAGTVIFVNDRGSAEVPLIGAVPAAGKSCFELAHDIRQLLEIDFFHRATVLVRHQYADNSRGRVTLVGRVGRPGPINLPADEVMTVSGAILRSGGVLPGADIDRVLVRRASANNPDDLLEIPVNLREVLEQGNLAADVTLRGDDIIMVPELAAASGSYYITGSVNAPGEFKLPTDGSPVMLSQAILRAGGFSKFANRTNVLIIRQNPDDSSQPLRFNVDVKAILDDGLRDRDIALRADDIVRVREVLFAF
jgi:polysaccharide biosynthesis/export protein